MKAGCLILVALFISCPLFGQDLTNMYGINFYQKGEVSFLEFNFDKENIGLEHFHVKNVT